MQKLPVSSRRDLSSFIVHLTRESDGESAAKRLKSILTTRTIRASNIHCLHKHKVERLSETIQNKFKVCCFTEIPLDQIFQVVGDIKGRRIALEAYGVVFRREYMISRGLQPAIYINDYSGVSIREAFDKTYQIGENNNFRGKSWKMLPFVNITNNNHDFSWEREWRFRGDFIFKASEIVCVVLPKNQKKLRDVLNEIGVSCIDPAWSYEQIVTELSAQVFTTANQLKSKLG